MSSCDASRSGRGEPQHMRRTVKRLDDEIRTWNRQKGEKSKLEGKLTLARLRSSSGYPKLKAQGVATRHMASFTLELAARHCACPSDRCVLGVAQTLQEIYHILEEEGMFLSGAAKTRLPELFHLLCNGLSCEALAEVPVVKEWKMSPEDAPVHPFDGVASA